MSTKAQINANRQNAQKSTGPKTAEGKAAVSQNGVKHGLFAAEAVIMGENPGDYELFRNEMLAELAPAGMVESMLAERVVSLSWRLKRAERMQNQVIEELIGRTVTNKSARYDRECYYLNQRIRPGDPRFDLDNLPLGRIATSDWSNRSVLDRMFMYERRIENSATKMMKELKRFQTIRRIERQEVEKQLEPSPSLRDEAATQSNSQSQSETGTRPEEKECDLKKQSQYAPAQIGAMSLSKGDYDNNPAGRIKENKANQSQSNAPAMTKGAGKRNKVGRSRNRLTG